MNDHSGEVLSIFAMTAPGLSQVAASELVELGLRPGSIEPAGVTMRGSLPDLYLANMWLRTASRVLVRLATFHARTFAELERHASKIDWTAYVDKRGSFRVRATARKSRLYHTAAIEQRIATAIGTATGASESATADALTAEDDRDAKDGSRQLFIVRAERDEFTISADSSGDLLHVRGYRQAVAKAPLRETLASAMLLGSGWTAGDSLLDPFCGSGTIPIEAAMIARRIAPGGARTFAFERWTDFDSGSWARIREDATSRALSAAPIVIRGSDRDEGAIRAAEQNATRAGVERDVIFERRPVSEIAPTADAGWIVTNPPYGVRLSPGDSIRNLYARLGAVAREKFPGGALAVLSADRSLEAQLRLPLEEKLRTSNGGIPVRLMTARIPAAAARR